VIETLRELWAKLELKVWKDYYNYNYRRFRISAKMIEDYCSLTESSKVLELGAWYPFIALLSAKKFGFDPYCSDIKISKHWKNFLKIDLCSDPIPGKWDLLICSEVLEHLPVNLYKVVRKITRSLSNSGYAFFTVPIGTKGLNIPLNKDVGEYSDDTHFQCSYGELESFPGHLREFTPYKAQKFFESFGLPSSGKVFLTKPYIMNYGVLLIKK
jgi:SAM-dependent methyltransferase